MNTIAGQLFDVFTEEEIESWANILKKAPPLNIRGNDCHGVDENNLLNPWFQKIIFSRIQELVGTDIKLVFGMFLNETAPWKIHTDSYHCDGFDDRVPAWSILIPYSVDNDKTLVDKVRTVVFNERTDNNATAFDTLTDSTQHPDSAVTIFDQHLSHNRYDYVSKLTVQGVYQWQANSLIYWDSFCLHDTDNFHKNGYHSKQAIVIHTYRHK